MKAMKILFVALLFTLGVGSLVLAAGPGDCPDADNDGICNGRDPDYVPGSSCNPDCPDADGDGICNGQDPDYVPGSSCSPDCPDADGDGICNGQDPDYTRPGGGGVRDRIHDRIRDLLRTHLLWM